MMPAKHLRIYVFFFFLFHKDSTQSVHIQRAKRGC